jgi:hypothetical protein
MEAANIVLYALAVVTSLACTVLLFRSYRANRLRLLLWSGLCFVGLTVSNTLLFFDSSFTPRRTCACGALARHSSVCCSCSTASSVKQNRKICRD